MEIFFKVTATKRGRFSASELRDPVAGIITYSRVKYTAYGVPLGGAGGLSIVSDEWPCFAEETIVNDRMAADG